MLLRTKSSPLCLLLSKPPSILKHSTQFRICNYTHLQQIYSKSSLFYNSFFENSSNLCIVSALPKDPMPSSASPKQKSKKSIKQAIRDLPENVLKYKRGICSKNEDLEEGIRLYEEALFNGTVLSIDHYNPLLYLCSCSGSEEGVDRGFDIFKKMVEDEVVANEATFTSVARLAAKKADPEMAFALVKTMKGCGIEPRLRSYGPALFGFCKLGLADKAYEVDKHMVESGVVAEEGEMSALLKVSSEGERGNKVYEMMHRLRVTVRQVTKDNAGVVEDWFKSESAEDVGMEKWNEGKVKEGVAKGGGGWHGQGWLGKGKWSVVRTQMDESGVCASCGEKLVCIDIDPRETENFASSLEKLASKREAMSHFVKFQEWLQRHGPFDAVVDGANVSLINQCDFNFFQLNSIVNKLHHISPSKRLPLVILHKGRVHSGPAQHPNNRRLLDGWKNAGALYVTPPGSNDDWYWLYAAITCNCLLVTNDEMRDHLFQLLGTSFFPRWKEKHQARLAFSKGPVRLVMPPPYSNVIQESEQGSWHIPTITGDDLETPRQWLCATRSREPQSLFFIKLQLETSTHWLDR